MSNKGLHVVPEGNRWSIRRAGATRASGVYSTEREALDAVQGLAQREAADVYIHGRDGRIRERNVYGSDPASAKN